MHVVIIRRPLLAMQSRSMDREIRVGILEGIDRCSTVWRNEVVGSYFVAFDKLEKSRKP